MHPCDAKRKARHRATRCGVSALALYASLLVLCDTATAAKEPTAPPITNDAGPFEPSYVFFFVPIAIGSAWTARRKRRHSYDALSEVSRTLAASTNVREVSAAVLPPAIAAIGMDAGVIGLVEESGGPLILVAHAGLPDAYVESFRSLPVRAFRLAETGESMVPQVFAVGDIADDDVRDDMRNLGFAAGIGVPFLEWDRLTGAMVLLTRDARVLSDESREFAASIASQMGIALSRLRLLESDRERRLYADLLTRVARRMTNVTERQDVLDALVEELQPFAKISYAIYYEADVRDGALHIAAAAGVDDAVVSYLRTEMPIPTGRVISDPKATDLYARDSRSLEMLACRKSALLPLIENDRILGALEILFPEDTALDETRMQFLRQLGELVILEMQKARLYRELASLNRSLAMSNVHRAVELENERDRIRAIVQSVTDALIVSDLERRIILANPAVRQMFEIRRDGETTIDEALGAEIAGQVLPPGWTEAGEIPDVDIVVTTADGVDVSLSARTAPVRGRNDDIVGYVTLFHDTTRQREVDRMKTGFISTAAHELRTPLTTLLGYSELLLTRNISEQDQRRFIGYIHHQSVVLGDITNNLLDISRLETGEEWRMSFAPCDVRDLCLAEAERARLGTKVHRFVTNDLRSVAAIIAEPARVRQIVRNLISNAVKYAPNGGEVILSCDADERWVILNIEDAGIGMTPEQVNRVFDTFYRGDTSTTAVLGTGLGMSIVQKLVHLHGGRIWIESVIGEGTTVHVALPRADAVSSALVVADDATAGESLAGLLVAAGWTASRVGGREEAIGWIEEHMPTMAVLAMPARDQILAIQRMNTGHRTSDVPLLLLTDNIEDRQLRHLSHGRTVEIVSREAPSVEIVERIRAIERRARPAVSAG